MQKTILFLRPNFQLVLISNENFSFKPCITVIEIKIKTNLFKSTRKKQKPNKTKGNFEFKMLKDKKRIVFVTKKAKR
jgi:hypothetical protein